MRFAADVYLYKEDGSLAVNVNSPHKQVAEAAENRVQLYLDENPWGMW